MAGKSTNSFGAKNFAPGPPATRYNVSGKNREFYTYENAPGIGAYATGGTIIDGGDGYIYHIFTGTDTFVVNRPSAVIDSVDYLIVAGGGATLGSPATPANAAGGGGGGFLSGNIGVSQTPYPVVVGAGGPNVANSPVISGTQRNGSPSTAFALTATGGGSGGNVTPGVDGRPGGSGGGGQTPGGVGFAGNTPATIPRQGYPGANANGTSASGGGGGAGGAGSLGVLNVSGGAGGPGRIDPNFPSSIVAKAISSPVLPGWNPLVGPGGYAAGGAGGAMPSPSQRTSPSNSGYGGQLGGTSGGSGIVCIRYKKNAPYTRATGGTVEPSTNPEHIGVVRHIFTGPGTFEVTDPTLQYIDYLAVGGGGGGGGSSPAPPNPGSTPGGGGGAGGFVSSIHTSTTTPTSTPEAYPWNSGYAVQVAEQYPVGPGSYPISIGAGGASGTVGSNTTVGAPGASQIIAAGGGAGGAGGAGGVVGGNGGSGGGGATPGTPIIAGGTATPTPLIQGNAGGSAGPNTPGGAGGGGGGAGGSGGGPPSLDGGIGWYSVLSPSSYGTTGPLTPNPLYRYFAGGGAGARFFSPSSRSGGSGGGGNTNVAGTVNTGGGGGGAYAQASGGAGGSGIVIIQYPE